MHVRPLAALLVDELQQPVSIPHASSRLVEGRRHRSVIAALASGGSFRLIFSAHAGRRWARCAVALLLLLVGSRVLLLLMLLLLLNPLLWVLQRFGDGFRGSTPVLRELRGGGGARFGGIWGWSVASIGGHRGRCQGVGIIDVRLAAIQSGCGYSDG